MPAAANQTLKKIIGHLLEYRKAYLTLLLLVILITPYFIRYLGNNQTVIGEPSYFHLNAAEQLSIHNFYQNPYHFLLSLNFSRSAFIYQAIPLLLAVLSLLLLINIVKEFKFSPQNQFFFLLFLILSPAFIYAFTILNHYSFFIFLSLLGFTLLLRKNRFLNCLSFPVFAIIPFFDVFSSILTSFFLIVYFYLRKGGKVKMLICLIIALTIFNAVLGKPFFLGPYVPQNMFTDFFFDFGSLFGFSLFSLLLAVVGLLATWKKEKFFLAYLFLPLFIILSFYRTSALIYLNFFIVFFASFGFAYFFNKEWKLNIIKDAFLLLLILGLIFSALTSLNKFSALPPSAEIKESFLWLKENTEPGQVIFSHPRDSYLIEYFSKRPAFIHYHDADLETKLNITNQIFQSTYIKETFPLLEQNNLFYICLSPKTKANLPPDRGLIFLFQNERFKRIYNREDIEIWEFK